MRSLSALSILILFCIGSSFAQDSIPDSIKSNTLSSFYILEDIRSTSGPKVFATDESPNYLQVQNNEVALLSGRFRANSFYLLGVIDGWKETIDRKGNAITSFFVRGRERSIGELMSFEIITDKDGDVVIHYFKKTGGTDVYFNAHLANIKEIETIKKYWKGDY